jgi:tetratricopeptide (TPR) repeat protein
VAYDSGRNKPGRGSGRSASGPRKGSDRAAGDQRGRSTTRKRGPAGERRGRAGDDRKDRRGSGPERRQGGSAPREERGRQQRTAEQERYDGPPLDESITGRELDRAVRQQMRGLPDKLAARVARHLVAAGQLIDEDPATAYRHTLAARARATRIAVVREACGEAAYAAGEFAEALSELRAAKRINGNNEYLPLMADCERALGRPDKALKLAKSPAVEGLPPELQAEMTIVEAGARRDRGELDAAIRTLEAAPLRAKSRDDWVVRLRYAYADTLLAADRTEDAVVWFNRAAGIDNDGVTDAADRLAELEGLVLTDTVESGPDESDAEESDQEAGS